jgi:hypothetical protein
MSAFIIFPPERSYQGRSSFLHAVSDSAEATEQQLLSNSLDPAEERLRLLHAHEFKLRQIDILTRQLEYLILKTNQKFAKIRSQFRSSAFPDEHRFVLVKNFYKDCIEQRKVMHDSRLSLIHDIRELTKPPSKPSKDLMGILDPKSNFMSSFFRKMTKRKSKTSGTLFSALFTVI